MVEKIGYERFPMDFYADLNTAFIKPPLGSPPAYYNYPMKNIPIKFNDDVILLNEPKGEQNDPH